ncbi:hypothetical protein CC86DRAFT_436047, partial [Ophiobolus disseminans]
MTRTVVPRILALHSQDLVDVMLHLEHCNDPRAKHVFNLANRGTLHPLNEQKLKPLRLKKSGVFNEQIFNSPILYPPASLPFDFLPTVAEVQRALKEDISGPNTYRFAPPLGSAEKDAHATIKLLNNIPNPAFSDRGAIIHMTSPTFDRLRTKTMPWAADGILGQSDFQITVAPANEVFDLEYSPYYTFSTLLSGEKIWIAYPPGHGNLDVLQRQYASLAGRTSGAVFMPIVDDLQHGIAIVQTRGQTLMLPPFWSYLVVSTTTSTAATYSLSTALTFPERMQNIRVQVDGARMWPDISTQQSEIIILAESLAQHLERILNTAWTGTKFKVDPVIKDTCARWDAVKESVARLCKMIDDGGKRMRVERMWQDAWLVFLKQGSRVKGECRIWYRFGRRGDDGAFRGAALGSWGLETRGACGRECKCWVIHPSRCSN